ncbi:hypothetical protein AB9G26_08880 [Francisella philomiragia]|uniref:hypothetical protein n=1 Tax=Francisella philomiragia TaxID=28110 RepID=UPI0035113858
MIGLDQICDEKGRVLSYKLSLAKYPNKAPLLIILHGHGINNLSSFEKSNWNVLVPLDNYGYDSAGSWWLGENGDFFVKNLLQKLIRQVSQKYNCEDNIFFYGSSMGGYGAILHGILSNAKAVYANVPQITFDSTKFFSKFKYLSDAIFGEDYTVKENCLLNYLDNKKQMPLFLLCENLLDDDRPQFNMYLRQHALRFLECCYDKKIKAHFEIMPFSNHNKIYGINEVITKFKQFLDICDSSVDAKLSKISRQIILTPDNKIYVETDIVENYEYAFYLHCGEVLEKKFYTTNNFYKFDEIIIPGNYKVTFYYKNKDIKKYVEESFIITDEMKLERKV